MTAPAMLPHLSMVATYFIHSLLGLAGMASLVMLLMGGFKYISAGGDKDAAIRARLTITYALAGLVITLSAWLILNLIGLFLRVDLNTFNICVDGSEFLFCQ